MALSQKTAGILDMNMSKFLKTAYGVPQISKLKPKPPGNISVKNGLDKKFYWDKAMAAFGNNYTNNYTTTGLDWGTSSGSTSAIYITDSTSTGSTASTWDTVANNYITIKRNQVVSAPPAPPRTDPRIRNKYLNASDLLEEFIKDLVPMGVKQSEVLNIPIELFINWLIIKAAEEDDKGDAPELPKIEVIRTDRCRSCGKYVTNEKRKRQMLYCNGGCFDQHQMKVAA